MEPGVQTRAAGRNDAPSLAQLHVDTWRAAYRGLVPDELLNNMSVAARERRWTAILAEGGTAWVAQAATAIIGFAAYGRSRDADAAPFVGEVIALYVHPDAWGSGVGRSLNDAALSSLAADGCREATLWVLRDNSRARRFYERQGWLTDGAEQTDDREGVRLVEVRYRVKLSPHGAKP
jgi:ribosomal protein S18 acetylase RimI-like enzyme